MVEHRGGGGEGCTIANFTRKRAAASVACMTVSAALSCGSDAHTASESPADGTSPAESVSAGETATSVLQQDMLGWSEALQALGDGNVAQYSYIVFDGGDVLQFPGPKYGTVIRLKTLVEAVDCPQLENGGTPTEGWSLYLRAANSSSGSYAFERRRNYHPFEAPEETMEFLATLEHYADGVQTARYIARSGTLELQDAVVGYADRDHADAISGNVALEFAATPVDTQACEGVGDIATGTTSETCHCLVDDSEMKECVPQDATDDCCLREVSPETVSFRISFDAMPCAGLCEAIGINEGLCLALQDSSFNDLNDP